MTARGVTLDLFGTLVEPVTRGAIHDRRRTAILHAFEASHAPIAMRDILGAYADVERYNQSLKLLSCASSGTIRDLLLRSLSLNVNDENRHRMSVALSDALPGAFRALPGARDFVRCVRQLGLKVAVVTNVEWESRADVVGILGEQDIEVDAVVTSTEIGYFKPRPEPFIAAADLLGMPPRELVHVGDDYVADYLGALAAGLSASLLPHRVGKFDSRHIFEIDSFAALISHLVPNRPSNQ